MIDECRCRDANFRSDLFPIFDLDVGSPQYGRESHDDYWEFHLYRRIDSDVCCSSVIYGTTNSYLRVVSTVLSIIGQFSGVISLSVPSWLAAVSPLHGTEEDADVKIAWGFALKAATRILIINESLGLQFNCSTEEIQSGVCVAQTGEQLSAYSHSETYEADRADWRCSIGTI